MRARHVQALAALTALAAILRFSTLHVQSYWFDEAVTVGLVKSSFGHMLSRIGGSESTPPLYYAIGWLWSRVFGTSEVGLRSLSALCGTAFVPVAWAAARELATQRVAIVAAALATVNPLLIWYSQEARSYALLLLLGSVSFLLFARMLREPSARTLAWWTIASGLAIATHYFAAFVVAPEALWLLLRFPDRRQPAVAIAGLAAVGGVLLPLLLHQRGLDLTSFITQQSLGSRLLRVPKQFAIGYDAPADKVLTVAAAVLVVIGLWLAFARLVDRERRAVRVAGIVGTAATGLPLLLALAGTDYFNTRNVIAAWLPLALVPSVGFGARHAGRAGTAAALGLCAIGLFVSIAIWSDRTYQRDDNRGLAEALGPATVPRAIVVTPVFAPVTLKLYLQPFVVPTQIVKVREVDLAALPRRGAGLTRAAPPPRPVPHPPAPGMRLVEKRYRPTYTLFRFQSAKPVAFFPAGLLSNRLDPRAVAVLYQGPPLPG
jgi:mannosyltransferase